MKLFLYYKNFNKISDLFLFKFNTKFKILKFLNK